MCKESHPRARPRRKVVRHIGEPIACMPRILDEKVREYHDVRRVMRQDGSSALKRAFC